MIPSGRMVALVACPLILGMMALVFPEVIYPMMALDILCVVWVLVDWMVTRGHCSVVREVHAVQSVGRAFPVKLGVQNQGRRRLKLQVMDTPPGQAEGFPILLTLRSGETIESTYMLEVGRRGQKEFGPICMRWASPFGFWHQQKRYECQTTLRVYPSFHQLRSWGVQAVQSKEQVPVRSLRRPGGENEFQRLRPYVFGDSYRHIDWKATARKREFVTREYGQESNQNVIFLLDSGRMMSGKNGDLTSFDHALNAALMMGQVALKHGDRVGLLAFDSDVRVWLPPKGGAQILTA